VFEVESAVRRTARHPHLDPAKPGEVVGRPEHGVVVKGGDNHGIAGTKDAVEGRVQGVSGVQGEGHPPRIAREGEELSNASPTSKCDPARLGRGAMSPAPRRRTILCEEGEDGAGDSVGAMSGGGGEVEVVHQESLLNQHGLRQLGTGFALTGSLRPGYVADAEKKLANGANGSRCESGAAPPL
jgi:hypothetical protein